MAPCWPPPQWGPALSHNAPGLALLSLWCFLPRAFVGGIFRCACASASAAPTRSGRAGGIVGGAGAGPVPALCPPPRDHELIIGRCDIAGAARGGGALLGDVTRGLWELVGLPRGMGGSAWGRAGGGVGYGAGVGAWPGSWDLGPQDGSGLRDPPSPDPCDLGPHRRPDPCDLSP